jgi:hypothetical protein
LAQTQDFGTSGQLQTDIHDLAQYSLSGLWSRWNSVSPFQRCAVDPALDKVGQFDDVVVSNIIVNQLWGPTKASLLKLDQNGCL